MSRRAEHKTPWPAYGLGAVAVLAPQLLGGATGRSALAIHLMACAACAWAVLWLPRSPRPLGGAPLVGIAALAAAVWTALQALPLPCNWVSWTQPERHELSLQLLALGAIDSESCSISAAPGATWAAFAQASTLAALFLASSSVARAGGRQALVQAVALSSIAMATVALGHWVMGADQVFGAYDVPVDQETRVLLAPLINENHLAGHLALGWPLCLALATSAARIDTRIAWFTGAFFVCVTGVLSLSRGGVAALVLGGTAFGALQLFRRRDSRRRAHHARAARLTVVMVSAVCLAAGAYVGLTRLGREFAANSDTWSKLDLIATMLPLAFAHPFVGIGRGAFGDVSASVYLANARAMYPENLALQWLSEWGWPCSLVLFGALAVSAAGWWAKRGKPGTEIALACGLLALFAQNWVDFSLELPGVASTAAVALGALLSRPLSYANVPELPLAVSARTGAALALVATLLAVPWLTSWNRRELQKQLQSTLEHDPRQVAEASRTAFKGYPLDPSFVVIAASAAARLEAPSTGRWLNLAMQVAPAWSGPHLVAGQVLERRGAIEQAAMEFGMAAQREFWPAAQYACALVQRHPSADLAFAVANEVSDKRRELLEHLTNCIPFSAGHLSEAERLAERILADYAGSKVAHERLIQVARARGDQAQALVRAERMARSLPHSPEALLNMVQILLSQKDAQKALLLIDGARDEVRQEQRVLDAEASAALAADLPERFKAAVERALLLHGKTAQKRADVHRTASAKLAGANRFMDALRHAQAAYDLTGRPAELEVLHQAAMRAGVVPLALRTASELCQVRHRDRRYCSAPQAP